MALSERLSYPWTTPFVGRQRELAQLVRQLDEAERGRCSIVLLTGEPGIGKTRLAEELCATAEERGAIVHWGECFEGEGAPAFWPWVQVLRAWVRSQSPSALQSTLGLEASDVAQIVPELRSRMPDVPEPASLPPTQARFRLFDSIVTVLQRMAARPLVLVLDDLHWADEPSLLLLEFLAAQLFDAPILVIGIYRDVEVAPGNALSTTLGGLLRRPRIGRVVLGRLSPDEVAELVEVMPGIETGARLAQAVLDRAEGNPLFVAEMLRLLDAERTDVPLGADADRVVPPTIQDVIGRRLSKLSEACRTVLIIAAVIGREFDLATLRTVSAEEDDRAIDALDEAEAVRIVAPTSSGAPSVAFRFMHALVRDTLYEALPASRRARLHLRIGNALERMAESTQDVRLSELAHHFVQAASICPPERVVGHVERAARHAVQILAYEDAARLFALALRVLETSPRPDQMVRCDLLLQLGAAESSMTDDTAARETFMVAAALARQLEPALGRERAAHLLAQAALGYGGARLEPHRVDARGIAIFEEALAAVGDGDSAMRAQLLARLQTAASWRAAPDTTAPAASEPIALARRAGDAHALADAILNRCRSRTIAEGFDELFPLYQELDRIVTQLDDPAIRMNTRRWQIKYLLEIGDLAAADQAVVEYQQMMHALRYPLTEWRGAVDRMSRALLVGDFGAAEQAAEEGTRLGPRQPRQGAPWFVAGELHLLRAEQGRFEEAERLLDELLVNYPNLHGVRSARAWVLYERGAVDEARRELDQLTANDFAELRHGGAWNYSVTFLSQLCVDLDDRGRAAELYQILLPQAPYNIVSGITFASYGAASLYLARLAATLDRPDEAARHFEEALTLHRRMQARPLLARTRYRYAAAILDRKAVGTREQALALAQLAADDAATMGMPVLHERSAALLDSPVPAQQPQSSTSRVSYPDGLTGREVEVLSLLAAGASNVEIARALVLSPGTVHTHTIRIYQKLGIKRRAEAAAYAVRHGFIARVE